MGSLNNVTDAVSALLGGSIKEVRSSDILDFRCVQCGQCCKNDNLIMVNAFDVYSLSKYFNMEPVLFYNKYLEHGLTSKEKSVAVSIKMNNGTCPFLVPVRKDISGSSIRCTPLYKCGVHEVKPCVCDYYPLGIATSIKNGNPEYILFKHGYCNSCMRDGQKTVQQWMEKFNNNNQEITMAHKLYIAYCTEVPTRKLYFIIQLLKKTYPYADDIDKAVIHDAVEKYSVFTEHVIDAIYTRYDVVLPFVPQAEQNIKMVRMLCNEIMHIYEKSIKVFNAYSCHTFDELVNVAGNIPEDEIIKVYKGFRKKEGM